MLNSDADTVRQAPEPSPLICLLSPASSRHILMKNQYENLVEAAPPALHSIVYTVTSTKNHVRLSVAGVTEQSGSHYCHCCCCCDCHCWYRHPLSRLGENYFGIFRCVLHFAIPLGKFRMKNVNKSGAFRSQLHSSNLELRLVKETALKIFRLL